MDKKNKNLNKITFFVLMTFAGCYSGDASRYLLELLEDGKAQTQGLDLELYGLNDDFEAEQSRSSLGKRCAQEEMSDNFVSPERYSSHLDKLDEHPAKRARECLTKSLSSDGKFICSECGTRLTTSTTLINHMRRHTGERPYECDWTGCGKAFSKKRYLKEHKRIHTDERPYECDWAGCTMSFRQSGHLDKHRLIHTGEKPHVCGQAGCGKAFTKKFGLDVHIKRMHMNELRFKCSEPGCEKAYVTNCKLVQHIKRSHTMDFKFKCSEPGCKMAFVVNHELVRHLRTHAHKRNYLCDWPERGKTFVKKFWLDKHIQRFHAEEYELPKTEVFKCLVCDQNYTTSEDLQAHRYICIQGEL